MFGVSVYTSPNPVLTELNIPFVVSINIDDIVEIRGYKVVIEYDGDILEFDQADNGDLFDGQPIGWWIVNDDTPGIIQIECLIFGAGLFVTGPGNILDLTYTATSEGITSLEFIETKLYDPTGLIIPDVTSIDGSIIIGDQAPPPQNLTINIVETTLTLFWDEIQFCTYNVYSTYSLEDRVEWHIEAENLMQSNWSCTIQGNENNRFFYVTAEFNFSQLE
jgi:hypothetical protein